MTKKKKKMVKTKANERRKELIENPVFIFYVSELERTKQVSAANSPLPDVPTKRIQEFAEEKEKQVCCRLYVGKQKWLLVDCSQWQHVRPSV